MTDTGAMTKPETLAWLAALAILVAMLFRTWVANPVPARPDDRPVGDIAFLLGLAVLPAAALLGLIGGALARPMPRLAPAATALLVTATVAAGANMAGFTAFHVLCGGDGFPDCATGVVSRVAAMTGGVIAWCTGVLVFSHASRRRRPVGSRFY
ncbi:MAG: hypothetical protein HYX32_04480 [Actinobacteria bacterium]|nr:hypothetical protein [Actinomycetota bacterium]